MRAGSESESQRLGGAVRSKDQLHLPMHPEIRLTQTPALPNRANATEPVTVTNEPDPTGLSQDMTSARWIATSFNSCFPPGPMAQLHSRPASRSTGFHHALNQWLQIFFSFLRTPGFAGPGWPFFVRAGIAPQSVTSIWSKRKKKKDSNNALGFGTAYGLVLLPLKSFSLRHFPPSLPTRLYPFHLILCGRAAVITTLSLLCPDAF